MLGSIAQAATENSAKHDGASGTFPPFDPSHFSSQLLWLGLTFGFFYFFMAKVALPRISNILEVRRDRISQDMIEAQRLKEETDAAIAAYEHELEQARKKAHTIIFETSDKVRTTTEIERAKIERELAGKLADAEINISKMRDSAMAEIKTIASDATEIIIAQLTGDKIATRITKSELNKAIASASQ